MADAAEVAQDDVPAKSKKPLIILVTAILVAVGASVAGTLYFVQSAEVEPVVDEEMPAENAKAVYHSMRPPFVVNFITENKSRYLQADITLMSRDSVVIEAIIEHGPLVRSEILQYLSDQNFTQLRTDEGKEQTRVDLKALLNEALQGQAQVSGIESVLLTNFVLQ